MQKQTKPLFGCTGYYGFRMHSPATPETQRCLQQSQTRIAPAEGIGIPAGCCVHTHAWQASVGVSGPGHCVQEPLLSASQRNRGCNTGCQLAESQEPPRLQAHSCTQVQIRLTQAGLACRCYSNWCSRLAQRRRV
jgi:hypothetical protein